VIAHAAREPSDRITDGVESPELLIAGEASRGWTCLRKRRKSHLCFLVEKKSIVCSASSGMVQLSQ